MSIQFSPPLAKQGTHTPYGGQKRFICFSRAPPPHGLTSYLPKPHVEVRNVSILFRVPPPHDKKRYPRPIWRSKTCQFKFACPPSMAQ